MPAALLAYLGVTVLAPWLRGSGGPEFAEHAATALVSAALLGGAWWGLSRLGRRRASRDPGALARKLLPSPGDPALRVGHGRPGNGVIGGSRGGRRRHSVQRAPRERA